MQREVTVRVNSEGSVKTGLNPKAQLWEEAEVKKQKQEAHSAHGGRQEQETKRQTGGHNQWSREQSWNTNAAPDFHVTSLILCLLAPSSTWSWVQILFLVANLLFCLWEHDFIVSLLPALLCANEPNNGVSLKRVCFRVCDRIGGGLSLKACT